MLKFRLIFIEFRNRMSLRVEPYYIRSFVNLQYLRILRGCILKFSLIILYVFSYNGCDTTLIAGNT